MPSHIIGLGAAVTTALCWSILAIFLKIALKYSDSGTIVFYRMVVAFFILFFFQAFSDFKKITELKKTPPLLILASLLLAVNYFGYMKGVELTAPANAQIFIQIAPLVLASVGIFYFKEKINRYQIWGLTLAFIGYCFFYYDRKLNFEIAENTYLLGQFWIFIGAITWAFFAVLQKILLKKWTPNQINLVIYLICGLVMIPVTDWESIKNLNFEKHILFFSLGINTLIAYGCLSIALKNLPATIVSPILIANPMITLLLLFLIDYFNLNLIPSDNIKFWGYLGSFLVVGGVGLVVATKKP